VQNSNPRTTIGATLFKINEHCNPFCHRSPTLSAGNARDAALPQAKPRFPAAKRRESFGCGRRPLRLTATRRTPLKKSGSQGSWFSEINMSIGKDTPTDQGVARMLRERIYREWSDSEVIQRLRTDVALRWFLGLGLNDAPPDSSTLSYFRSPPRRGHSV
jgi:hypothetical protein